MPAVALTAFVRRHAERALAAGFDACLSKPAKPRELIALLGALPAAAA